MRAHNAAILALLLAAAPLSASDRWPQFRGLQAGVADDDPALPETWSETENIAWNTRSVSASSSLRQMARQHFANPDSYRVRGVLVPSITTPSASGIVNAMRSSGPKFRVM